MRSPFEFAARRDLSRVFIKAWYFYWNPGKHLLLRVILKWVHDYKGCPFNFGWRRLYKHLCG